MEIPREADFCECQIVNLITDRTLYLVCKEDKREVEKGLFPFSGVYDAVIASRCSVRVKRVFASGLSVYRTDSNLLSNLTMSN